MKFTDSLISIVGVALNQFFMFLIIWLIAYGKGAESLGEFNYYLTLSLFIGGIFVFRYELSCVSHSHEESKNIMLHVMCLIIIIGFILLSLIFILNINNILSLSVLLLSFSLIVQQLFIYYNNTRRKYVLISILRFFCNAIFICFIFLIHFLDVKVNLFFSYSLVHFSFSILLIFYIYILCKHETVSLKKFLVDNAKYPIYIFPSTLLASVMLYGLAIYVPYNYGFAEAGIFAIAYRLGSFPVTLVGQSIGGVLRRDMLEGVNEANVSKYQVYFYYLKVLLFFVFLYLLFNMFILPKIILHFLGDNWYQSLSYLWGLLPLFSIQIIYVAFSQIFLVCAAQKLDFIINLFVCFTASAVLVMSYIFKLSLIITIYWFSLLLAGILVMGICFTYKAVYDYTCD